MSKSNEEVEQLKIVQHIVNLLSTRMGRIKLVYEESFISGIISLVTSKYPNVVSATLSTLCILSETAECAAVIRKNKNFLILLEERQLCYSHVDPLYDSFACLIKSLEAPTHKHLPKIVTREKPPTQIGKKEAKNIKFMGNQNKRARNYRIFIKGIRDEQIKKNVSNILVTFSGIISFSIDAHTERVFIRATQSFRLELLAMSLNSQANCHEVMNIMTDVVGAEVLVPIDIPTEENTNDDNPGYLPEDYDEEVKNDKALATEKDIEESRFKLAAPKWLSSVGGYLSNKYFW